MLKRDGPLEWFHCENMNIKEIEFHFRDKEPTISFVSQLSSHLFVSVIRIFKIS